MVYLGQTHLLTAVTGPVFLGGFFRFILLSLYYLLKVNSVAIPLPIKSHCTHVYMTQTSRWLFSPYTSSYTSSVEIGWARLSWCEYLGGPETGACSSCLLPPCCMYEYSCWTRTCKWWVSRLKMMLPVAACVPACWPSRSAMKPFSEQVLSEWEPLCVLES